MGHASLAPPHNGAVAVTLAFTAALLIGCGTDGDSLPANALVRDRIAALAPAANLAHRGAGPTRGGRPPENSIPAFLDGMAKGADGIELDVELTIDGALVIMHDDTLGRTTDCSGCVSHHTFAEVRECRLLGGDGMPTNLHPPTLAEVYRALPPQALVNVELKVFDPPCATATTGPAALAQLAVFEVQRLGAQRRTLFSSFSEAAAIAVKEADPTLYSALLLSGAGPSSVQRAVALGLDAIHPLFFVQAPVVALALDAGLQVNIWTVDTPELMRENLAKGATAIITNDPAVLAEVLTAARRDGV